jgi:hypothetical protein
MHLIVIIFDSLQAYQTKDTIIYICNVRIICKMDICFHDLHFMFRAIQLLLNVYL